MNRKILIIPSWYPTKSNPIIGLFFKEQAEIAQEKFDIKILYGVKQTLGIKKLLKLIGVKFRLSNKMKDTLNYQPITPPEVEYLVYPHFTFLYDNINYYIMLIYFHKKMKKIIKNNWKPDIIHAHCTVYAGIVAHFLSKKLNIPFIITEHQVFMLSEYSEYIRSKVICSLQAANKVIAVSYHQMRCILMHNINCNLLVLGNYINDDLFKGERYQKRKAIFKILTITYPGHLKDVETFFKAIQKIVEKGIKNISVTVVGNNSFTSINNSNVEKYKELASKYKIEQYCNLIPFVEREHLPELYGTHDIFVSTSIAETFGVSICEAIISGLPVICTNSGGVEDFITRDNGIMVNIRDYEAIAESIIKVIEGELKFNSSTARESIISKYGKVAFRAKLNSLYSYQ